MYLRTIEGVDPMKYAREGRSNRRTDYVELVQLLADGHSAASASAKLGVRVDTVTSILTKLRRVHRVRTTTQLVAHYIRNGIVD